MELIWVPLYILLTRKKYFNSWWRFNNYSNYSIDFTATTKKFCLSLHYNGAISYIFVNATEIIKFKAKDSIAVNPLCLGNISESFSVAYMKKTRLYQYFHHFSVDYKAIAVDEILDIQKYLMKKNTIKWCLGF